jgi:hypothetical protein
MRSNTRKNRVRVALAAHLVLLLSFTGLPLAFGANVSFQIVNTKIDISVEDFALCTGSKYEFTQSDLVTRGYESCKSQSLTTQNLPASLHVKVRVDLTQNANDWYLHPSQSWDLRLTNAKGEVINVRVAGPTTINDKNGNSGFSAAAYGIYFLVLELPSSQVVPAGDYVLDASLCDSACGNGRTPTPRFKLGSFTIQEVVNSSTKPTGSVSTVLRGGVCEIDTKEIRRSVDENLNKVISIFETMPIRNFETPGLLRQLQQHKEEIGTSAKFFQYWQTELAPRSAKEPACLSYLDLLESIRVGSGYSSVTANNIEADLAKAEYWDKTQNDECTKQSLASKSSISNSAAVIIRISQEISDFENKGGFPTETKEVSVSQKLTEMNEKIRDEVINLRLWTEKLNIYYKNDPKCANYLELIDESTSRSKQATATSAKINSLIAQVKPTQAKTEKSVSEQVKSTENPSTEKELELDGETEDPSGDLSVGYQSSTKKYLVSISSNLSEEDLVVRATKKGAKALQYKVTTNAEGNVKFSTKNLLKGFTMTLLFNGERLDSIKIK